MLHCTLSCSNCMAKNEVYELQSLLIDWRGLKQDKRLEFWFPADARCCHLLHQVGVTLSNYPKCSEHFSASLCTTHLLLGSQLFSGYKLNLLAHARALSLSNPPKTVLVSPREGENSTLGERGRDDSRPHLSLSLLLPLSLHTTFPSIR